MAINKYQMTMLAAIASCMVSSRAEVYRQDIADGWSFRQARGADTYSATVPGTVHTDLMANGLIPDPFVEQNERQVQWVDKEDWIYETAFDLDAPTQFRENVDLVFDGLDTYADVYLNDSLILRADNMFRRWSVPVKTLLRKQDNRLKVYFHSPIKVDLPKFDALPWRYECGNDQSQNGGIMDKQVSVFARKAGYHYGWDWGPRLVTSGIWRPVYLQSWSGPRIDDIFVRTLSLRRNKAAMAAEVEISAPAPHTDCVVEVVNRTDGRTMTRQKLSLDSGLNRVRLPFEIKNPRLWWCNGLGSPELYDFEVQLLRDGKKLCASTATVGVRTIELVRDEDADGRSFYFRLNGVPVFAKGANYIPCDNFLPRVTSEVYRRTVQDAADANMNMLRVWGGGVYEDDRFYNLCDSLGIMVWQDFMFACSMYPAEGALLENIRQEAVDNVLRLRNHPSIAVWCGNNECLEAWYNWGWRRRYTKQGVADTLWRQFGDVYFDVLPKVVAELAPDASYTPSSPFSREDGSPEPARGDCHLWRVWGGEEPIDVYNQVRSRFFSEYGFQSFPEIGTVLKYAPSEADHRIDSDVMLAHQRAGAGANRRIERYLLESYPSPKDFESFLYMSQVLQGDAIRTAIEAHRRDMPYCMGSLFWQHNDCWPVASWSSRDYFGNWKAQHYMAARAYRDVMLSTMVRGDSVQVYVVSDRRKPASGTLSLQVGRLDGKGAPVYTEKIACGLPASAVTVRNFELTALLAGAKAEEVYILAEYTDDCGKYENITLPVKPKDAAFTAPAVKLEISGAPGDYTVSVVSDNFVRAFRMTVDGNDGHLFSDNYFDLIPGREYKVKLRSILAPEQLRQALGWTSLYDASKRLFKN